MTHSILKATLLMVTVTATACGGTGGIELTIHGLGTSQTPTTPLVVPDMVDELHLDIRAEGQAAPLLSRDYSLADRDYPLTLSLITDKENGRTLDLELTALKADAVVEAVTVRVPLDYGQLTPIIVKLGAE
jgi:hypothetical protein